MKEPIYKEQDYGLVREVRDDSIGLRGYLVIGSKIKGLTCGGLRIHDDVNVQELIDLAKVMELKQTFLGMPRGGARAGIIAPYSLDNKHKQILMNRFAELVQEELMDRKWLVAIDVGTNVNLVQNMYKHVGVNIPKPSQEIENAGFFTALGVVKSIEVCLEIKKQKLHECTFAIEGMGNVGANLFSILKDRGAKVIAVSNIERAIVNEGGLSIDEGLSLSHPADQVTIGKHTEKIPKDKLLELPVSVLCPCATDSTINSSNASNIRAQVICAGANNPITYEAVCELFERGILYLPDFITNAGGALGNMVKFAGLPETFLHNILANEFVHELNTIHVESQRRQLSPTDIAVEILSGKFVVMKRQLERNNGGSVLREFALSAYRRGAVPKILMRPFAIRKIRRSIGLTIQ